MEVGRIGVHGLDVQSRVEVEPGPDPDLVPIRHLSMEETVVLDQQLKIIIVTTNLAQVSISTYFSLRLYDPLELAIC